LELSAQGPCPTGALDQACEVLRRLLAALPGATARVDEASLHALAAGAGLPPAGAAARLHHAGAALVTAPRVPGAARLRILPDVPAPTQDLEDTGACGPLRIRESWE